MNDCIGTGCKAESLLARIVELTKERDAAYEQQSKMCHVTATQTRQLAASQAQIVKLRKEVYIRSGYSRETLDKLFPTDDSALQQRLAEERERCAKACDDIDTCQGDELATAIRSLT